MDAVRVTGNGPALAARADGASLHQRQLAGLKLSSLMLGAALVLAILEAEAARIRRNSDW